MRSTSVGCLSRRSKQYITPHDELRSQVKSRGVNGHRFDAGRPLTLKDIAMVVGAWAIFGVVFFGIAYEAIHGV